MITLLLATAWMGLWGSFTVQTAITGLLFGSLSTLLLRQLYRPRTSSRRPRPSRPPALDRSRLHLRLGAHQVYPVGHSRSVAPEDQDSTRDHRRPARRTLRRSDHRPCQPCFSHARYAEPRSLQRPTNALRPRADRRRRRHRDAPVDQDPTRAARDAGSVTFDRDALIAVTAICAIDRPFSADLHARKESGRHAFFAGVRREALLHASIIAILAIATTSVGEHRNGQADQRDQQTGFSEAPDRGHASAITTGTSYGQSWLSKRTCKLPSHPLRTDIASPIGARASQFWCKGRWRVG